MVERNQALALRRQDKATGGSGSALVLRAKYALDVYGSTGSGLASLASFVFPGLGWTDGSTGMSYESGYLAGYPRDSPYRNVNGYNSSIVMACVNSIVAGFKQAKPRVFKYNAEGTKVVLPTHRLQKLLKRPNKFYSWSKLIGAVLVSFLLKGNAYLFREKAQNGFGATLALYYIPHYMIIPRRSLTGGEYVSHYEYNVDGKSYRLRPEQVIHLKYDIDPYNTLLGREILHPVLTEVYTDEKASKFTSNLLRNTAMPGIVIVPDTDKVKVTPKDAEAIKETFIRRFSGDQIGMPFIPNFAAKVFQLGFNPEQMQLKDARRLPEERVAAVFNIAASFAGLGAGLDRSTYSNYEQAEKSSYESGIVPLWDDIGEDFSTAFSAEFFAEDESYGVEFDYSKVKALSENADGVATRTTKIWVSGGMTRAEYRQANGLLVDEARDSEVWYADTRPKPVMQIGQGDGGGIPPANGNGAKKTLREKITAVLMLKAAPAPNLDNAYGMSLEADVSEVSGVMERELDAFFSELGDASYKAASSLDPDNPKAETERILEDTLKAIGLTAVLVAIWGRMAEEIEDGTKIAVALRLALPFDAVWTHAAGAASQSAATKALQSYESALREQSKAAILEAIKGAESGESVAQIASRIKGMVEGKGVYPGIYAEAQAAAKAAGATDEQAIRAGESKARRYRAKLIAEAEVRTHQNIVALEAMSAAGTVEGVRVEDGVACGWRNHDDTDKAHNTTRPIVEARRYALAHPNCKRRFYPVTQ